MEVNSFTHSFRCQIFKKMYLDHIRCYGSRKVERLKVLIFSSFGAPSTPDYSGLMIVGNIFLILGSELHTLTKNQSADTFH